MKRLTFSYGVMLLMFALAMTLPSPYTSASQNQPTEANNPEPQPQTNKKPARIPSSNQRETNCDQRGTKNDPLFVEVLRPDKTATESAPERNERDEKRDLDRQTIALNKETVRLNGEMTNFTGWLAILAGLQFFVLIVQAVILARQTGYNRSQTVNQKVIERAYIQMSHYRPGLYFELEDRWWVRLKITNHGRTPGRVTMVKMCGQYISPNQKTPDIPDYSAGEEHVGGAFLVPGGEVSFLAQGMFTEGDVQSVLQQQQGRFLLYGYIDYVDQFETRHRSGYAREYSPHFDRRSAYLSDQEYAERSNLPFLHERSYNYDRERQPGEGNDWGNPL